ncbi:MAG: adenine deaminase [Ruminococcus sp.]|nr:adenine deaminase [Candidatus Apopatosoma intestinale]
MEKKAQGVYMDKLLLSGGTVVNVFTGELEKANVLIKDSHIIGVGNYTDTDADRVEDVTGKVICPGFVDGHIHIESTMLTPAELTRVCLPHGTTAIVADPHEIANVCGTAGIHYMLEMSEGLPMTVYIMLPSCVPATPFDESGAVLTADDLRPFYEQRRVLGLAEMMNYVGVVGEDPDVWEKIADAHIHRRVVDGHAPLLSGRPLDKYLLAGIRSDHECTSAEEAKERIRKGQWIMIRQGTAARNLTGLLPLFDEPFCHRCLLVTDDKHPADLLADGHIDSIIRAAVRAGKSAVTAIQMATIRAAHCFELQNVGAIAPGYKADLLILDDLDTVAVRDVYCAGKKTVENGKIIPFTEPVAKEENRKTVLHSFFLDPLTEEDFRIRETGSKCRVIRIIPGELLTDEWITEVNREKNDGIDVERDILKLAVIERHMHTGHKGIGYINGIGLKKGAIASSVSHDSHNLIVIGTNDADMAIAANRVLAMGGGNAVAADGKVVSEMPLPVAGLMTAAPAAEIAEQNRLVREAVHALGAPETVEPFMNMAFVSLPVIPSLKMTTQGLVDVNTQTRVPLVAE